MVYSLVGVYFLECVSSCKPVKLIYVYVFDDIAYRQSIKLLAASTSWSLQLDMKERSTFSEAVIARLENSAQSFAVVHHLSALSVFITFSLIRM